MRGFPSLASEGQPLGLNCFLLLGLKGWLVTNPSSGSITASSKASFLPFYNTVSEFTITAQQTNVINKGTPRVASRPSEGGVIARCAEKQSANLVSDFSQCRRCRCGQKKKLGRRCFRRMEKDPKSLTGVALSLK